MPVIRSFARTDVGRKRKHNEDAMLVDDALGLYIVADGMGGHAAGEVASAQATRSSSRRIAAKPALLKDLAASPRRTAARRRPRCGGGHPQARARTSTRMAGGGHRQARHGHHVRGLVVGGNKGVIGHVGDSRVYLVRNGQCHQLTEDHTLIAGAAQARHDHQGAGGHRRRTAT